MDEQRVQEMARAIENNQQDSPALTIDPASNTMSVVGNPNDTHPTSGKYKITYAYRDGEIPEEDKKSLRKDPNQDIWYADVEYENRRVRPAYRTRVTSILLSILADIGVITEKGYSPTDMTTEAGMKFLEHTEEVVELACIVLGERRERVEYMNDLVDFFNQLLNNEHNLINEATNFLASSSTTKNTQSQPTEQASSTQG